MLLPWLVLLLACHVAANGLGALYNIRFHHAHIPQDVARHLVHSENQYGVKFETFLVNKHGVRKDYLCSMPPHVMAEEEEVVATNSSSTPAPNLLQLAVEEVQKLFSDKYCVFAFELNAGYWTYSYCFGDKIIQYHEGSPVFHRGKVHVPTFPDYVYVLGRQLDRSKKEVRIENQANGTNFRLDWHDFSLEDDVGNPFVLGVAKRRTVNLKVLRHRITGGTLCDLTNKPRSVDVIYKCDPNNNRGMVEIVEVYEITTCQYQMVINTPRLCLIPEFIPSPGIEEKVFDLDCKLVDSRTSEASDKDVDFYQYLDEAPILDLYFPVPNDYKISISDYKLSPLGYGFHFGHLDKKHRPHTNNLFFNFRHVLVYNSFYDSLDDLNQKVGRVFIQGIESTLVAPIKDETGNKRLLSWNDTFTIFMELYDFTGDFIALTKIHRNGRQERRNIEVQLIDPETMLDQDGDPVDPVIFDPSLYQAPENVWNFQYFSANEREPATEPVEEMLEPETITQTIKETVTVMMNDETTKEEIHDELWMPEHSIYGAKMNLHKRKGYDLQRTTVNFTKKMIMGFGSGPKKEEIHYDYESVKEP